jgi:hypothetical protein
VVISARNFIRALGGSAGLAIASAIFSNTLVSNLSSDIPAAIAEDMRNNIFELPDISGITQEQQILVLDSYVLAARSVFYLWMGAMSCCLLLMVFIKDKGLVRQEEKETTEDSGPVTSVEVEGRGTAEGRLEKQIAQQQHNTI